MSTLGTPQRKNKSQHSSGEGSGIFVPSQHYSNSVISSSINVPISLILLDYSIRLYVVGHGGPFLDDMETLIAVPLTASTAALLESLHVSLPLADIPNETVFHWTREESTTQNSCTILSL